MARWRDVTEKVMAVSGVVLVLVPVLLMAHSAWQVAVVVAGLLLVEAGIWGLASPLLPDERKYLALRREVDAFLEEVRHLNEHATAGDQEEVERCRRRLHARVDVLVESSGVRDA